MCFGGLRLFRKGGISVPHSACWKRRAHIAPGRATRVPAGRLVPANAEDKAVHTRDKPVVLRVEFCACARPVCLCIQSRRKTHGTRKTRHKTPSTAEEV